MVKVTVKTLNSACHEFDLEEGSTVEQLKALIQEKVCTSKSLGPEEFTCKMELVFIVAISRRHNFKFLLKNFNLRLTLTPLDRG